MSLVEYQRDPDGIVTLTLNDPDRRNAMGLAMAAQFQQRVAELSSDKGIRALILTGAPPAFSAGGDLEMLTAKSARSFEQNRDDMLAYYHSFLGIVKLPFPTVCAINGHAVGAGLGIALACDVRLVCSEAKLGFNFTRLGLYPGMGTTFFVPRLVGHAVAIDLLTTGRLFSAEEGLRMGFVSRLFASANEVLVAANTLTKDYLQCGPAAVASVLKTLRPDTDALNRALEREAGQQSKCYASAEFAEGLSAALERRRPQFGR